MASGLLRRALVGAVLLANVAVVGVATSFASSTSAPAVVAPAVRAAVPAPAAPAAPAAPQVLPTLPPLLQPSPSPSPTPPPPKPAPHVAPPQDRWALLVGITNYRSPVHDTVAGAQDISVVRDTLLRAGWRSDHIRVLTDNAATGKALQDGLTWLIGHSSASTASVFHYSGHVKQRDGHEYLWPVDNAFYSDSSVTQAMRAVRGTSWTSIAGCEAAGFDDGLADRNHLFSASSASYEKSYEYPDWKMSVWTGVLWDQGLRKGAGDTNADGHVTVQEAVNWGAPRAAQITKDQRPHGPQHPYIAGGNGALRLDAPVVG
ncbi:MAG: caspase family protein [Mycobacteriales bacterium]